MALHSTHWKFRILSPHIVTAVLPFDSFTTLHHTSTASWLFTTHRSLCAFHPTHMLSRSLSPHTHRPSRGPLPHTRAASPPFTPHPRSYAALNTRAELQPAITTQGPFHCPSPHIRHTHAASRPFIPHTCLLHSPPLYKPNSGSPTKLFRYFYSPLHKSASHPSTTHTGPFAALHHTIFHFLFHTNKMCAWRMKCARGPEVRVPVKIAHYTLQSTSNT